MKVYVSNVNLPVPRSISRYLAHTIVGCRKQTEGESEEDAAAVKPQETYEIVGSISAKLSSDEDDDTTSGEDVNVDDQQSSQQSSQQQQQQPSSGDAPELAVAGSQAPQDGSAPAVAASNGSNPVIAAATEPGATSAGESALTEATSAAGNAEDAPKTNSVGPASATGSNNINNNSSSSNMVGKKKVTASKRGNLSLQDKMPASKRSKPKWVHATAGVS